MMSRRNLLLFVSGAIILLCLALTGNWFKGHRQISISTDSTPIKIQLNNSVFLISSQHKTIRLPNGVYNYAATYGSGSSAINLYGSVDTIENPNTKIVLNYKVFSDQAIKDALCMDIGLRGELCDDSYTPQKVSYLDDHAWAIVMVAPSEELGNNIYALKLTDGAWQRVAGPFAKSGDFTGLVPPEVQGAVTP